MQSYREDMAKSVWPYPYSADKSRVIKGLKNRRVTSHSVSLHTAER